MDRADDGNVAIQLYYSGPCPEKVCGAIRLEGGFRTISLATTTTNSSMASADSSQVCSNIESLAINSAPEQSGVTDFVQEACTQVEVLGERHVPSLLFNKQGDIQNLTDYFARPRLIDKGSLSSTRSLINNVAVNPNLIFTGYFENGLNRLTGVYGAKYSLVYTFQVAATPFHQGLVALAWQYNINQNVFDRGQNPYSCTTLPHVRLDLSVDTMVQLKVPWMSCYEYLIPNSTAYLGSISYNLLSGVPPITGMGSATYKVYVHIEDLEFSGASPIGSNPIVLQGGKPMNLESEIAARPFSSGLSAMSGILSMVARGVPSLSSIAAPAAWFTGIAAGVVRSFGFSKPVIKDPIQRMIPTSTALEQNVDVPQPLAVVGPFCSNELRVDPNFSNTDIDEMALAYVVGQYSQINYGNISTADTHGNPVYASPVSPSVLWFRQGASQPFCNVNAPLTNDGLAANSFYPSSLFYVAQMFRAWRGDIVFRFTFVKTKMHGGRYMASFTPAYATYATSDTYNNVQGPELSGGNLQPFGQSMIMDLKDSNVFEFRVPFVSPQPFAEFNDSIGGLVVSVMDPLIASSVISTTVNFIVEVKAAPDFELSIPRGPQYPSLAGIAGSIRTQSGTVTTSVPDTANQYTIGERIMSLKQLIMLPQRVSVSLGASTNLSGLVFPWWYGGACTTVATTPNAFIVPPSCFTYGGNIARLYAFVKGGTDVHVYNDITDSVHVTATVFPTTGAAAIGTLNNVQNPPRSALPYVNSTARYPGHFRFPAYQAFARVPSGVLDSVQWGFNNPAIPTVPSTAAGCPLAFPELTISNLALVSNRFTISRSAGDDAACGMYIGPTPLYLPALTSSAAVYDPDSTTLY